MLGAAALWGTIGLFVGALFQRGLEPLEVAFWRAALGAVPFALDALLRGCWRVDARREGPALLGFALVGVTGFYAALPLAIAAGGVSLATVLLYTAPAWVVLLARPVLGEALSLWRLGLCALALAGVALLALGGGQGVQVSGASLGWGLAAGLAYATYYLAGKPLFARIEPRRALPWVLPLGALGLRPLARPRLPADPATWALLGGLAVVCTWLPFRLYAAGLQRGEASRAALLATLEPVVGLALAAAVLGERLDPAGLLGSGLVLLSAAGAAWSPRRPAG